MSGWRTTPMQCGRGRRPYLIRSNPSHYQPHYWPSGRPADSTEIPQPSPVEIGGEGAHDGLRWSAALCRGMGSQGRRTLSPEAQGSSSMWTPIVHLVKCSPRWRDPAGRGGGAGMQPHLGEGGMCHLGSLASSLGSSRDEMAAEDASLLSHRGGCVIDRSGHQVQ